YSSTRQDQVFLFSRRWVEETSLNSLYHEIRALSVQRQTLRTSVIFGCCGIFDRSFRSPLSLVSGFLEPSHLKGTGTYQSATKDEGEYYRDIVNGIFINPDARYAYPYGLLIIPILYGCAYGLLA